MYKAKERSITMGYTWIALLILGIVVEAFTANLVLIWFLPGTVVAMILAFCNVPLTVQLIVFVLMGLVLLFAMRPLSKRLKKGETRTNKDALIGQTGLVTEEICNIRETGEVKLGGLRWSARSAAAGIVIPKGTQVEILDIQGVKLIVK
jgi:membrane protein implicated in regulation of membrane protease activity